MPGITTEAFFKKRRRGLVTYLSISLNFSFPILEILLSFFDPEEYITIPGDVRWGEESRENILVDSQTIRVAGRWIYSGRDELVSINGIWVFLNSTSLPPGFSLIPNRWLFVLSHHAGVRIKEFYIASFVMNKIIFADGTSLCPENYREGYWCIGSPGKFNHWKDLKDMFFD